MSRRRENSENSENNEKEATVGERMGRGRERDKVRQGEWRA